MRSDHEQALNLTSLEYYAAESSKVLEGQATQSILDDTTGATLTDPVRIRRYRTERTISRFLVLFLSTVAIDDRASLWLSRGPLAEHLRSHSEWIDQMLALSNEVLWEADQLYPAIGQDAWLLTQKQASMFLDAVVRINRPIRDPKVRSEYDSLVKMLRKATEGTPHRILIRAQ